MDNSTAAGKAMDLLGKIEARKVLLKEFEAGKYLVITHFSF